MYVTMYVVLQIQYIKNYIDTVIHVHFTYTLAHVQ